MAIRQAATTPAEGLAVRIIGAGSRLGSDHVQYGYVGTWFGTCAAAFTELGLCWLAPDDDIGLPDGLGAYLPEVRLERNDINVQRMLNAMLDPRSEAVVHLFGTDFQLRVWQALTEIPFGARVTYGELARQLGDVKLARAVGSAIGRNPVAWIVPCHRVVPANGSLGGYRWGTRLKQLLLATEETAANPI
jgi:AraC family transcriptional regulator of adaptative response/methylated-DNA-[protein]-cysteine methyltransferase